jgi:hypothetical protein
MFEHSIGDILIATVSMRTLTRQVILIVGCLACAFSVAEGRLDVARAQSPGEHLHGQALQFGRPAPQPGARATRAAPRDR